MKKTRFTDEQMITILRETESAPAGCSVSTIERPHEWSAH